MILFMERPEKEQDIIREAYKFEIEAIMEGRADENPFVTTIREMREGKYVWEAINIAVELFFN